jgi:hypothetical protein
MNRLWYHVVAFLVVAVWGSTFVFTKLLLLNGLTAAQIFVLRFILAYVLLLAFSLTRKHFRLLSASVKDELLMVGLGVFGGSLYFLTENSSMNYTTTTNTSLIVCLCPLFAALLISIFYRSERLNGIQTVGSLMAALGVVVVVLNGHFVLHLSPLGDTLAFAACLCWAVHHPQGVFLWTAVHDSLLHRQARDATAERGAASGRAHQPVLPGLCGFDALFPGMELGDEAFRGSSGDELCVFQSGDDGALCVDHPVGAHYRLFPDGHPAHTDRHVSV